MGKLFVSAFIVAIVTAAVFGQARAYDFIHHHDPEYVTENIAIQDGLSEEGIRWAFTTTQFGHWAPLTWLSYEFNYSLFGLNPAGYHLINVLLHMGSALLLLFILYELFGSVWLSCLSTLLFAVHPLNVEPVFWVSSRGDLLFMFCGLAAVSAYISYARKPSILAYGLVTLLLVFGLMSKSMAATFPLLLLLLDAWPLNRWASRSTGERWRLLLEKIPWMILSITVVVIHFVALGREQALGAADSRSVFLRFGHSVENYGLYLIKYVWPTNLIPHYSVGGLGFPVAGFAEGFVILFIFSVLAWEFRTKIPALSVGWCWFVVTLVPVVGFLQLGDHAMADRSMYLPQIGLLIGAAGILQAIARKHSSLSIIIPSILVLFVLAASTLSWRQGSHWRNTTTIFEHTLAVEPENVVGHMGLGLAQIEHQTTLQEGIAHLQFAAQKFDKVAPPHPNAGKIFSNLGAAYMIPYRYDLAIPTLKKALEYDPKNGAVHRNLAYSMWQTERLFAAREHCLIALDIDPTDVEAGRLLQFLYP